MKTIQYELTDESMGKVATLTFDELGSPVKFRGVTIGRRHW